MSNNKNAKLIKDYLFSNENKGKIYTSVVSSLKMKPTPDMQQILKKNIEQYVFKLHEKNTKNIKPTDDPKTIITKLNNLCIENNIRDIKKMLSPQNKISEGNSGDNYASFSNDIDENAIMGADGRITRETFCTQPQNFGADFGKTKGELASSLGDRYNYELFNRGLIGNGGGNMMGGGGNMMNNNPNMRPPEMNFCVDGGDTRHNRISRDDKEERDKQLAYMSGGGYGDYQNALDANLSGLNNGFGMNMNQNIGMGMNNGYNNNFGYNNQQNSYNNNGRMMIERDVSKNNGLDLNELHNLDSKTIKKIMKQIDESSDEDEQSKRKKKKKIIEALKKKFNVSDSSDDEKSKKKKRDKKKPKSNKKKKDSSSEEDLKSSDKKIKKEGLKPSDRKRKIERPKPKLSKKKKEDSSEEEIKPKLSKKKKEDSSEEEIKPKSKPKPKPPKKDEKKSKPTNKKNRQIVTESTYNESTDSSDSSSSDSEDNSSFSSLSSTPKKIPKKNKNQKRKDSGSDNEYDSDTFKSSNKYKENDSEIQQQPIIQPPVGQMKKLINGKHPFVPCVGESKQTKKKLISVMPADDDYFNCYKFDLEEPITNIVKISVKTINIEKPKITESSNTLIITKNDEEKDITFNHEKTINNIDTILKLLNNYYNDFNIRFKNNNGFIVIESEEIFSINFACDNSVATMLGFEKELYEDENTYTGQFKHAFYTDTYYLYIHNLSKTNAFAEIKNNTFKQLMQYNDIPGLEYLLIEFGYNKIKDENDGEVNFGESTHEIQLELEIKN